MLNQLKTTVQKETEAARELLGDYKRPIIALIAAVVVDHFLLGGKISDSVVKLATKLRDNLIKIVDRALDKLGLLESEGGSGDEG